MEMRIGGNGKPYPYVQVTCQKCGKKRMMAAGNVTFRIKWGKFTGHCNQCKERAPQMRERMVAKKHPAPARNEEYEVSALTPSDFSGGLTTEGRRLLTEFERNHSSGEFLENLTKPLGHRERRASSPRWRRRYEE